jgi:uncharacterized protein YcbK (DUF882 family)
MRIATSFAVLMAVTLLPALPAKAQVADASSSIQTSQFQHSAPRFAHRSYRAQRAYRGHRGNYAYRARRGHSHAAHQHSHGGATTSRSCLTADTRAVLAGLEARFGTVKVISTCRPGAVIAGSGRPSQHRYGKAVDFMPNGNRAAVMAWLRANTNGAVITYSTGHIHFDTGGYRNFAISAKARRSYARAR